MQRSIHRPPTSQRQRMRYPNHGLKLLYRKLILVVSTFLFLFGLRFWSRGMMGQELSAQAAIPCDPPHVEYRLNSELSSSSDGVLRYAAYHKVMLQNGECDASLQPLTIEGWTNYMMGDHADRLSMELTNILKSCSFQAFRFETKGTNADGISTIHFEFAIVNDDYLYNFASDADPHTFADKLATCPDDPYACVFGNLGGDAMLVSPKNVGNGDKDRYGHIAAFLRKAPTEQIQSVWKTVIKTYRDQLQVRSPAPVWFSAAGGGVAWLHYRFDKRPKYYHYIPFKQVF